MNKKIWAAIGAGIGVGIMVLLVSVLSFEPENKTEQYNVEQFTDSISYSELNSKLRDVFSSYGISMSSAIELKERSSIDEYCDFFESEEKQNLVEFCTSTELKDIEMNFLGNIHMIGPTHTPKLVLAVIQVDPFTTQLEDLKTVFTVTVETLVCDCWELEKPDGFESVDSWVDGLREFHTNDVKPHSKSKIINLENHKLQIELTTNTEGYLWKLLVEDNLA